MDIDKRLEETLAARSGTGGEPSVAIDAGGNPIFPPVRSKSALAYAALAQVSMAMERDDA